MSSTAERQCPQDREAAQPRRVIKGRLFRARQGRRLRFVETEPPAPRPERKQPFRVARMLALAHKMQGMIDRGEVKDRASLARRLGFTRARISQLLDLTLLAPDLQEEILFMEVAPGRDPITERGVRVVVRSRGWGEQRRRWADVQPHQATWA